jgi:hypothetical protein
VFNATSAFLPAWWPLVLLGASLVALVASTGALLWLSAVEAAEDREAAERIRAIAADYRIGGRS